MEEIFRKYKLLVLLKKKTHKYLFMTKTITSPIALFGELIIIHQGPVVHIPRLTHD